MARKPIPVKRNFKLRQRAFCGHCRIAKIFTCEGFVHPENGCESLPSVKRLRLLQRLQQNAKAAEAAERFFADDQKTPFEWFPAFEPEVKTAPDVDNNGDVVYLW